MWLCNSGCIKGRMVPCTLQSGGTPCCSIGQMWPAVGRDRCLDVRCCNALDVVSVQGCRAGRRMLHLPSLWLSVVRPVVKCAVDQLHAAGVLVSVGDIGCLGIQWSQTTVKLSICDAPAVCWVGLAGLGASPTGWALHQAREGWL
eukprot:5206382-Amphidinium_carterae.1